MLYSGEISKTRMMYIQNPEGCDHGVAEKNCRLYVDVVPRKFPAATTVAARFLVDIFLAKAIVCAYFCARSELGRGRGSRDDVTDAYISISGLMSNCRRVFLHMDPDFVGNEDVAEIMILIQLDGSEESEFEEYKNMSD